MHGTYNRKLIKNIRTKKKNKVRQELYNCKKEHWPNQYLFQTMDVQVA